MFAFAAAVISPFVIFDLVTKQITLGVAVGLVVDFFLLYPAVHDAIGKRYFELKINKSLGFAEVWKPVSIAFICLIVYPILTTFSSNTTPRFRVPFEFINGVFTGVAILLVVLSRTTKEVATSNESPIAPFADPVLEKEGDTGTRDKYQGKTEPLVGGADPHNGETEEPRE
jgi:hypothetical protein